MGVRLEGMSGLRHLFGRSRRWIGDGLIVVSVGAVLLLAAIGLSYWLPEVDRVGDALGVLQVFVTALVIVAGGIFAYRKLQLFRDFEPHLTVTQTVTSRAVGTRYSHIAITTTLHNSSKVRVEVRESLFRIHQIQPWSDEDVEHYYVESFQAGGDGYVGWPVLDEIERSLEPNELVVEPGEYHHEPCEFIVSRDVSTVLVYSYFFNLEWSEYSQSAQGWTATTVHDIVLTDRQSGD